MASADLYDDLHRALAALFGSPDDRARIPWETKLSSLIALLRERNPKVSWVGAYVERPTGSGTLWVDSYQGKVACLEIRSGKGVCGTAFQKRETLIVPDVEHFPGHIACDAAARSEIVLPLYKDGNLVGVLDLDSHEREAFNADDARGIESLLSLLA